MPISSSSSSSSFVNVEAAMNVRGVSRHTIYNWMQDGSLPYIVKAGHRFVDRSVLLTRPRHPNEGAVHDGGWEQ